MGTESSNYTYKNMEDSMVSLEDPAQQKRFLALFQRQRGFPKPSAESKRAMQIQVSIEHDSDGILQQHIWKLPAGALLHANGDSTFLYCLLEAYSKKQTPSWYSLGVGKGCDICQNPAVGGCYSQELGQKIDGHWQLVVHLHFLCPRPSCNNRQAEQARKKHKRQVKKDPDLAAARVHTCSCCGKSERVDTPLLVCGRCQATDYCSRECQRIHWNKGHKEMCKEIVKRRSDRAKAKANKKRG